MGFKEQDRIAKNRTPKGVCEDGAIPPDVELTQEDLDRAAQTFGDTAKRAHATSNGLFIGCELCGQAVQLTPGGTFSPDRFCKAAKAARDTKQTEPIIPEQAKPAD